MCIFVSPLFHQHLLRFVVGKQYVLFVAFFFGLSTARRYSSRCSPLSSHCCAFRECPLLNIWRTFFWRIDPQKPWRPIGSERWRCFGDLGGFLTYRNLCCMLGVHESCLGTAQPRVFLSQEWVLTFWGHIQILCSKKLPAVQICSRVLGLMV